MKWLKQLFGFSRPAQPRTVVSDRGFYVSGFPEVSLSMQPTSASVLASEAFTPTQPKSGRRRLVGREVELARILQALGEDRSHVVLFSERGRGKTSLANSVVEVLRRGGSIVARHTCEAGTTFENLMRGLMSDLPRSLLAASAPGGATREGVWQEDRQSDEGCVAALPNGVLRPRDIVALPHRLTARRLVCVIDEFDRVGDPSTRIRLADTIKQLSDGDVSLQFLIVGVSENLEEILGQHPSIQRSVLGVHLPLFTDGEVAELIVKGGREAGLVFESDAVARIAVLARGMPYMAQLLGLRLAQAARTRGDSHIVGADFDIAIERLIGDAPPRVLALYGSLTNHGRDADMVLILRRVATAPQDPWGRLDVRVGENSNVSVGGRTIPQQCWKRLLESHVLQPQGLGMWAFAERALMHHVLLLDSREGLLAGTTVAAVSNPDAAKQNTSASGTADVSVPGVAKVASADRQRHRVEPLPSKSVRALHPSMGLG